MEISGTSRKIKILHIFSDGTLWWLEKVKGFFSRNIFLNLHKIKKAVTSQNVLKGIRKIRDWYLPIEFAFFNSHHRKNRFLLCK